MFFFVDEDYANYANYANARVENDYLIMTGPARPAGQLDQQNRAADINIFTLVKGKYFDQNITTPGVEKISFF